MLAMAKDARAKLKLAAAPAEKPARVRLPNGPRWYAVHTGPRQEREAATNLKRQGFWVWYPFERVRKRRKLPNREQYRIEWIEVPYFSRYIFVALRFYGESLFSVNETDGVSTVVAAPGREPLEIPEAVMEALFARADEGGLVGAVDTIARKRLEKGTLTRVKAPNPFAGFIAEIIHDGGGKEVRAFCRQMARFKEIKFSPEDLQPIDG